MVTEPSAYAVDNPLFTSESLEEAQTARFILTRWQIAFICLGTVSWLILLKYQFAFAFTIAYVLSIFLVLMTCLARIFLAILSIINDSSLSESQDKELLDGKLLPTYSILVPLYKEVDILPHLTRSLLAIDYPCDRLEIVFLLEVDDLETIEALADIPLPSHFRKLIIPDGYPKTKARACNVGLAHAHGEFLVIYDAEDRPDSDQLRKAVDNFKRHDEQVACIQAQLNYYNPDQNILTRLFTLEYSFWFDFFLPGLSMLGTLIPLGGTSNHFRTSILRQIGGWDAYNVAEDCELGARLTASGYRTVVMSSTTLEEANSKLDNWIRQRSRWVKGYIQTYLVHMRNPKALLKRLGLKHFLVFQLTIGGTFLVLLLSPMFWLMVPISIIAELNEVSLFSDIPNWSILLGYIGFVLSNITFIYSGILGAMARNNKSLSKYIVLMPVYFALQSVAAWKGLFQLFTKPHFWEKTNHGFFSMADTILDTHSYKSQT